MADCSEIEKHVSFLHWVAPSMDEGCDFATVLPLFPSPILPSLTRHLLEKLTPKRSSGISERVEARNESGAQNKIQ